MTQLARPGDLLAGKYRVEQVLGEGGMGVVLAARHLRLDELVAIKLMRIEMAQDAGLVVRFLHEARAASKIKSEHVVRISDADTLESGAPYMVMEHLSGRDLASKLRDEGPQGIAETADFVLEACDAIAEAHSLGIIHRDLKPANLFLATTRDGGARLKVLDFGISKLVSAAGGQDMTRTAAMLGSPMYMSPEQMLSTRDVDARTDIWSLGVVLYQLLAGEAPFRAETIPQVCALVLQTEPRRLRDLRPEVPAGLEAVVDRCLQKDREKRFPAVADLAAALAPFGPEGSWRLADRISRLPRVGPGARVALGSGADHPATGPTLPPSGTFLIDPMARPSYEWAGPTVAATPPPREPLPHAAKPAGAPALEALAPPAPPAPPLEALAPPAPPAPPLEAVAPPAPPLEALAPPLEALAPPSPPPAPETPARAAASGASSERPSTGTGVSATLPVKAGAAPKRSAAPAVLAVLAALATVLGIAVASFRSLRNSDPTEQATTSMASPPTPATVSGQQSPQEPPPAPPAMAGTAWRDDRQSGDATPATAASSAPTTSAPAAPATSTSAHAASAPAPRSTRPAAGARTAPVTPKPAPPPARPAPARAADDPFGGLPQ
ncbi:serine/threonine-protein kinase [Sorangium sp. So ce260]|uniref:serine/threonine-protein kinase n=1 Tax=Sorangium sp. So ce260 TaxID=3133291 RepID=UPI003F608AE4